MRIQFVVYGWPCTTVTPLRYLHFSCCYWPLYSSLHCVWIGACAHSMCHIWIIIIFVGSCVVVFFPVDETETITLERMTHWHVSWSCGVRVMRRVVWQKMCRVTRLSHDSALNMVNATVHITEIRTGWIHIEYSNFPSTNVQCMNHAIFHFRFPVFEIDIASIFCSSQLAHRGIEMHCLRMHKTMTSDVHLRRFENTWLLSTWQ